MVGGQGGGARHEPHAEVRYVFVVCHTTVPHFQHIKVIPSALVAFIQDWSGLVEDIHDRAVEAGERAIVRIARTACIGAVEGIIHIAAYSP